MKCTFVLVIAFLALAVQCQKQTTYTDIIQTHKGPVRGRQAVTAFNEYEYSEFIGIPYAKPPLGDLRFKDSVEPDPWTEPVNATVEAPMCIQPFLLGTAGSENCLYLNVYTPETDFGDMEDLRPVLVWIYGGAFELGGILQAMYGPDWFIEDDIVVVAMNYRLGALGFLALQHPDAPGNQALKDQILALQWVQKNIAKFGGDPNKVTIMGESAGAAMVMYHVLSPMSTGLFHQAIAQSGSPLCPWAYKPPTVSNVAAYELGAILGIAAANNTHLLDRLKRQPAIDIVQGSNRVSVANGFTPIIIPFAPTIEVGTENPFMPQCPISLLQSGKFNKVPVLLGYNADETVLFDIAGEIFRTQLHALMRFLNNFFDPFGSSQYLVDVMDKIANGTQKEMLKVGSSVMFNAPIDLTQKLLSKHNGDKPIYYYRLSFNTPKNLHRLIQPRLEGTAHCDDLPLLFHVGLFNPADPDAPYNQYSKRVASLWTNFIKYTDPTPRNNTVSKANWAPSTKKGRQLDIGNEEFKMHDRLADHMDHKLSHMYSTIWPTCSECKHSHNKQ
ncbi:juvenile hormone esterase-like [Colletes gigas]|uniref:juvenile hormone esterase-like n=1 Tax=Colletes gigas TaxID=935657 RepID=UPI001C9B5B95|nr:juvenile hormone esterase-like [Colletes gigas]